MAKWWAEEWAIGSGRSRVFCGIARTEEGYAVDVFRGDTCLESYDYRSRVKALEAAYLLKVQYRHGRERLTRDPSALADWQRPGGTCLPTE